MFNTIDNMHHMNRSSNNNIINKLKNSESLYHKTFTPKRKLLIYTQPDSIPIKTDYSHQKDNGRNLSIENNYKRWNHNLNSSKSHKFLRYDTGGVNRAMNILLDKD
jgi:hypothetical protein